MFANTTTRYAPITRSWKNIKTNQQLEQTQRQTIHQVARLQRPNVLLNEMNQTYFYLDILSNIFPYLQTILVETKTNISNKKMNKCQTCFHNFSFFKSLLFVDLSSTSSMLTFWSKSLSSFCEQLNSDPLHSLLKSEQKIFIKFWKNLWRRLVGCNFGIISLGIVSLCLRLT